MENVNVSQDDPIEEENFLSPLGNIDYWEKFYEQELNQNKNNSKLIGEIWFGKSVQNKVVDHINKNFPKDTSIIDIGCGNAAFLLKLAKNEYLNLQGMDYSTNSIKLASEIIREKNKKNNVEYKITLFQDDINNSIIEHKAFDLIHDKGTLDAFLSNVENKHETYINYLKKIKRDKSTFIITSCNYSKSELLDMFKEDFGFKLLEEISHKRFSFGGSTGQPVTTLKFEIK